MLRHCLKFGLKHLRAETWDEFKSKNETLPVIFPRSTSLSSLIAHQPDHVFFDDQRTPEVENASAIIIRAFKLMCEEAKTFEADKPLTWRNYNPVSIPHLTRIPAFGKYNISTDGAGDALNATRNSVGPSWRMVVEQGEKVKAFAVYPGGQSGNPGSPYYTTGLDKWTKGEYFQLEFVNGPNQLKEKVAEIKF